MNIQRTHATSRRHFTESTSGALAATDFAPVQSSAGEVSPVTSIRSAAAEEKITIEKLRGNVSVLIGSGGNIGVLTGRDGKLLVDAGIPASKPRIMAALDSLGPEPVKHLINTHWHFDHTDGNEWLHAAGAKIIAHEKTRERLSTSTRVEGWNFTFPPSPPAAVPAEVFKQDLTLKLNASELILKYYGPAHTDSDISVEFSGADILHVGDTWWNGHYPFIDYSTGGSIDGAIRAAEANVARVNGDTLVIPGHGPVGGKAELTVFRDMLVDIRAKVSRLKLDGRTLEEVVAAQPTAAYDKQWGGFVIDGNTFTSLVYAGT